jgi:imidazoleglycerol phosphate dehydratase HisB
MYNDEVNKGDAMIGDVDEYLTRCVVDPSTRTFLIYSNLGNERKIDCANSNEFMNVLSFVRSILGSDTLVYADPLVRG